MKHTILQNTLVTLSSFIFVITVLNAWTGPSTTPPDPNVSAPLNVSSTGQQKTGGLIVGSLISGGSVQIGNTTTVCAPTIAGAIRWNTGVMEYCNGTVWGPFVGSSTGGGGSDSPYCAFSGQSKSAGEYSSVFVTCSMNVDDSGFQTIEVTAYGNGVEYGYRRAACTNASNNQNSVSCTYTGSSYDVMSGGASPTTETVSANFNRTTGDLTCLLNSGGFNYQLSSVSFTKDESKCSSGGTSAESDPTVLTSVKDGVSWGEVTGKPSITSVPSGAVFIMTSCPGGWSRIGVWGTIQDQTGIGGITVFQCQAP